MRSSRFSLASFCLALSLSLSARLFLLEALSLDVYGEPPGTYKLCRDEADCSRVPAEGHIGEGIHDKQRQLDLCRHCASVRRWALSTHKCRR